MKFKLFGKTKVFQISHMRVSISQQQNINPSGCDHIFLSSLPSVTQLLFQETVLHKVPQIQIEIHLGSHNAIATGWLR